MTETVSMTAPREFDPRQVGVLTEAKLVEWSIDYTYDSAVPVAELKKIQEAQVRFVEHQQDKATVEEYATLMRQGVVFPPVVLLHEDIILDGNTRIGAAKQAGIKTLPAFKCNFANPDLAKAFAGAMNQTNGRRLSPEEARSQAEILMRYKFEDDAIARELGYGRTHVNNWRRELESRERADAAKVSDALAKIAKPAQRQLAGIKQNAPFAAAANLIAETKLPAKKVTELVKAVQTAPSEADALNAVGQVRQEIAAAGPPPIRVTVPEELAQCRRILPQLTKLQGRELALLENDPEKRDTWIAQWRIVGDLAAAVLSVHGA